MRAEWRTDEPAEGDMRKLVTIEHHGVIWVGIRWWDAGRRRWLNGGVLTDETIIAWQNLPAPSMSDGLMSLMPGPTLPENCGND